MSTLVVYYSAVGETRRLGEAIAGACGADLEPIGEAKSGGGTMGFQANVLSGVDEPEQIAAARHDPGAYDLVAIGTPAVGDHMADAVRSFISIYRDRMKDVAFFAVQDGHDVSRIFREMEEALGRPPVATAALTPGDPATSERDRVARFAAAIHRH